MPSPKFSLIRKQAHAIYRIFFGCKNENFHWKKKIYFFLIFVQNIDRGYTLEPFQRGGSNEYPQSMFWSKIRIIGIPLHTQVLLYKSGFKGYTLHGHVFLMEVDRGQVLLVSCVKYCVCLIHVNEFLVCPQYLVKTC